MRILPTQNEPSGLPGRLLLGLALLCLTPSCLLAKDDQAKGLPPRVERVLQWLPEDTETLIVARSVTLPEPELEGDLNWQDFGVGLAIGEGLDWEGGKLLKPLRGRKIECVVFGAKNFEGVSSFGSLRSESCSIIVFEDDLGNAAKEWTEGLRKNAKAVRNLVEREVFVFPSTTVMEPWVRTTTWQGTYIVLLKPDTLLCASSDRYLETVLRRVNEVPKARALPANLPEWKQVDFDASVWMLRHVPNVGARAHTVGSTTTFMRNGFRVAYVPKTGSNPDIKRMKEEWLPKGIFDSRILRERLKIDRQSNGTVIVSFSEKPKNGSDLWFGFQLYRLQAFELFHADE